MRTLLLLSPLALMACRSGAKVDDGAADTGALASDADADGDGFVASEDCDDNDASVNTGATEICDGIDNDCDGEVDEDVTSTFYTDADADGYGDPNSTEEACSQPPGTTTAATDCDDNDATVNPIASERCDGVDNDCDGSIDEDVRSVWYMDADGDGFGDPDIALDDCDPPDGYADNTDDCDDLQATVNPDADEVCDGVDNDCDGSIDNDALDAPTWYSDGDGDGYGDPSTAVTTCDQPSATVADDTDCDDADIAVNPGATEVCNSIDDDCDSLVDDDDSSLDTSTASTFYSDTDADGFGDPASAVTVCVQPGGTVPDNTDCNDRDAAVNPAETEICNGIDDDCDALVDDADSSLDATTQSTFYSDVDNDGYGDAANSTQACAQPAGTVTDSSDCDDASATVNPGASEVCNSIDDDCDTLVDDNDSSLDPSTQSTFYSDVDSDGYGDAASSTQACSQPAGTVTDATDCDDATASVNPGETEVCNSIDDDCDGAVDDADASLDASTSGSTWYDDDDGDGYGDPTAATTACVQPTGTVTDNTDCDDTSDIAYPDALEFITGSDTDCDGTVDEAAVAVVFANQCLSQSGSTSFTAAQLTEAEELALEDHLLDMSLGLDRYDEPAGGWGANTLADYDLLLMSKCGWGWAASNQALLDTLLDRRDDGVPTFVFGDDMAWNAGSVSDYSELILTAAASTNGSPGPSTVTPLSATTHPILAGSYGTVAQFTYDRDIDETAAWGNGETVLATRGSGGGPVWVAYTDTAGTRAASYLGSIHTCNHVELRAAAQNNGELLFQNTVEWLLDL